MSMKPEVDGGHFVIACQDRCAICGGRLVKAIDLPVLPITDSFCREPVPNPLSGIDQALLYCESCAHGQLEVLLSPAVLYGSNYCFRTSASATARKGTEFFLSVLEELAPGRHFHCVLDIGCSDLYLLKSLKDRADYRVGIDPVWRGHESECEDSSILIIGEFFESVDFSIFPAKPDLIVCRHTLEHVFEPKEVIRTLLKIGGSETLYLFEVPGFDCLIQRLRFDQVFHQHAHYFSLGSFLKLLNVVGGYHIQHRFNYHDWGAMAVAFVRQDASVATTLRPATTTWALADICKRYELFHRQMQSCEETLRFFADGPIYGYGAAQMLPVLGYHMGTDFGEFNAILDDDPAKDGSSYWNLPVQIKLASQVENLAEATVLITAIDNVQPIMNRLLARRPRHILHPLNII